ncbi:hypothetical protein [Saccharopolyspora flava]|uniref:hypothetical protein n=1 Tax=Saccharopolyspora flava TaxID=95161 RepID=UPI000B81AE74|nr:hypothetical protein [Saccharopolyspora flava]
MGSVKDDSLTPGGRARTAPARAVVGASADHHWQGGFGGPLRSPGLLVADGEVRVRTLGSAPSELSGTTVGRLESPDGLLEITKFEHVAHVQMNPLDLSRRLGL